MNTDENTNLNTEKNTDTNTDTNTDIMSITMMRMKRMKVDSCAFEKYKFGKQSRWQYRYKYRYKY